MALRKCAARSEVIGGSVPLPTIRMPNVIYRSGACEVSGNWKPAGITPTTLQGFGSSVTAWPTTSGLELKCDVHKRWLRIAAHAPGCSSAEQWRDPQDIEQIRADQAGLDVEGVAAASERRRIPVIGGDGFERAVLRP